MSNNKDSLTNLLERATRDINDSTILKSNEFISKTIESAFSDESLKGIQVVELKEEVKNKVSALNSKVSNLSNGENNLDAQDAVNVTQLIIASIVLLILGLALARTVGSKKKPEEKGNEKADTPSESKYQSHHLLLILPANQVSGISVEQNVTKTDIERLIRNAARAYCYAADDQKGKDISSGVSCADESIDTASVSRVFLQLTLLAEPSIAQERNKLGIIGKIKSDSSGTIIKLAKLKSAQSTQGFYDL